MKNSKKQQLVKFLGLFFAYFQVDLSLDSNQLIFELYESDLREYPSEFLTQRFKELRLTWIPKYRGHFPTVAEILEPLKAKKRIDLEEKWCEFKKYCFVRVWEDKYPGWILEMKKMMGADRLDNCTKEDFHTWVKKDFIELYQSLCTKNKYPLLSGDIKNNILISQN